MLRNFDQTRYNIIIIKIDSEKMYQMTDVNLAWNFLEVSLTQILKTETPIVKVQQSTKYKNWVTNTTKYLMKERDQARIA